MKTTQKKIHSTMNEKGFTILTPKKLTQLTGGWIVEGDISEL